MLLTPHFSLEELTTTTNKKYKEKNLEDGKKKLGKLYMLAGFAERVREIVGKPLIITSGYRCKELNQEIGGAKKSQHVLGEAIDFVVKGMTTSQIACKLVSSDLKFEQLIFEHSNGKTWIHIAIGSKKEIYKYENNVYVRIGE